MFPVLNPLSLPETLQIPMTVFIPPYFEVFSNINNFWVFIPVFFYTTCEILKFLFVLDITCIKLFDGFN